MRRGPIGAAAFVLRRGGPDAPAHLDVWSVRPALGCRTEHGSGQPRKHATTPSPIEVSAQHYAGNPRLLRRLSATRSGHCQPEGDSQISRPPAGGSIAPGRLQQRCHQPHSQQYQPDRDEWKSRRHTLIMHHPALLTSPTPKMGRGFTVRLGELSGLTTLPSPCRPHQLHTRFARLESAKPPPP